MNRLLFAALPVVCLALTGCQCCALTEHYADAVDCVAYDNPNLDALYCPGLDLTRIGMPDWCQYRFNRLWCHRGCCMPNCGEPPRDLCCPFCLPERPVAYTGPAVTAPPPPPAMAPGVLPTPQPPADEPPPQPKRVTQTDWPLLLIE